MLNHPTLVHKLQALMPKDTFLRCVANPGSLRDVKITQYVKFARRPWNHTEKDKQFPILQRCPPRATVYTYKWKPWLASCSYEFQTQQFWGIQFMVLLSLVSFGPIVSWSRFLFYPAATQKSGAGNTQLAQPFGGREKTNPGHCRTFSGDRLTQVRIQVSSVV